MRLLVFHVVSVRCCRLVRCVASSPSLRTLATRGDGFPSPTHRPHFGHTLLQHGSLSLLSWCDVQVSIVLPQATASDAPLPAHSRYVYALMSRLSSLVSTVRDYHTKTFYSRNIQQQSIAYSDGQNVRFASAANFEAVPERVCRGGWGTSTTAGTEGDAGSTVTAMAFDVASPRILYVGTKAGDLMVGKHASRFSCPEHIGTRSVKFRFQLPGRRTISVACVCGQPRCNVPILWLF